MDSNSRSMSFCSILHFLKHPAHPLWMATGAPTDALGNVNPIPTTIHSAAFSLSLFLSLPTPKEKVFAVALPLERLFCSQSWVATSPWAPSSPSLRPFAPSFS